MIPIRLVILGLKTLSRMQGLNMNGREPNGIQKVDLLPTAIKVAMTETSLLSYCFRFSSLSV